MLTTKDNKPIDTANPLPVGLLGGGTTVDTELPAAVAAADVLPNPTAPQVLAHLMIWNGTNWDRFKTTVVDASGPSGFPAILQLLFNGTNWDRARTPTKLVDIPSTAITAGTPITVYTPTSGKKVRLFGYALSYSVAGSVIFKFAAGGTLWFRTPAVAVAGIAPDPGGSLGNGILPPGVAANDVIKLDATASGNVAGYLVIGEE